MKWPFLLRRYTQVLRILSLGMPREAETEVIETVLREILLFSCYSYILTKISS